MTPSPADKRAVVLGRFTQTVRAQGLRAFSLTASYLPQTREVSVRVLSVPSKDNRAAVRASAVEAVPWPQGLGVLPEPLSVKAHVRGVARRFLASAKAHIWPEATNLTAKCFPRGQDIATGRLSRCAGCSAWYCTVER